MKKKLGFAIGAFALVALFQNFTSTKTEMPKLESSQLSRMPSSNREEIDFNQLTDESARLENDLARKMKSLNGNQDADTK